MPSRTSLPTRILIGVASFAVALVLAELLLRNLHPAEPPVRLEQFSNAIREGHDVRFREVFESDPELVWRLAPGLRLAADAFPLPGLVSNQQGLREDHAIPTAPGDGLRILFVGDSCTFGYRLQHTDSVVALAEAQLQQAFPDRPIECINAGVPGYSLFQGWRYLETEGLAYEPDLVVLHFGWNGSARWDGRGDAEHHALWLRSQPPRALGWSRLAQVLWETSRRSAQPALREARPRLLPQEFALLLEQAQARCAERGIDLLVLIGAGRFNVKGQPERRTAFQAAQVEFGRTHAFPSDGAPAVVDTVPLLQELARSHTPDELFLDDVHPTALTNRKIAEELAARLGPWARVRLEDP